MPAKRPSAQPQKPEKPCSNVVQGFVIKVSDSRKSIKFHNKYSNLENCVQLVLLVGFSLPAARQSLKFASSIPMRLS